MEESRTARGNPEHRRRVLRLGNAKEDEQRDHQQQDEEHWRTRYHCEGHEDMDQQQQDAGKGRPRIKKEEGCDT